MSYQNSLQETNKKILLTDAGVKTELVSTATQNRTITIPDKTGVLAVSSEIIGVFSERIPITTTINSTTTIGNLSYIPLSVANVTVFVNGQAFSTLDSTSAISISGKALIWIPSAAFNLDTSDEVIVQYFVQNCFSSPIYQYPPSWSVPWVSLPLLNGWAYLTGDFEDPAYRKHLKGLVEIKGLLTKPSNAIDDQACGSLPISCTPSKNIIIPSRSYNSSTDRNLSVTIFIKPPALTTTSNSNFKPNGVITYSPGRQSEDTTNAFWFSIQSDFNTSSETALFFGDSNTIGEYLVPIDYTKRWTYLLAQAEGVREDNVGISGTVLQNTSATLANNARDRVVTDVINRFPDRIYIMYGTNDVRRADVNYTAMAFKIDYLEIIDIILGSGISTGKITIASPPYGNPANYTGTAGWDAATDIRYAQFQQAVREVAIEKKVKYADVYQYTKDNGGVSLLESDGVHLNRNGHVIVSNLMRSATIITV